MCLLMWIGFTNNAISLYHRHIESDILIYCSVPNTVPNIFSPYRLPYSVHFPVQSMNAKNY